MKQSELIRIPFSLPSALIPSLQLFQLNLCFGHGLRSHLSVCKGNKGLAPPAPTHKSMREAGNGEKFSFTKFVLPISRFPSPQLFQLNCYFSRGLGSHLLVCKGNKGPAPPIPNRKSIREAGNGEILSFAKFVLPLSRFASLQLSIKLLFWVRPWKPSLGTLRH